MSDEQRAPATDAQQHAAERDEPAQADDHQPATVEGMLDRLDRYWHAFRALVAGFPGERIDQPIERGWTRKQMLAHVAAWHDATTARLLGFSKTGQPQALADPVDTVNARVARVAIGRTSGEVIDGLDASFGRLRRQVSQLSDEQLAEHDRWAASVIAANTYEHYDEHAAELLPGNLSSTP